MKNWIIIVITLLLTASQFMTRDAALPETVKKMMNWVMAATLVCGASVFTACTSDNGDNPVAGKSLAEKIVGKWIHVDTDGSTYTITAHLKKVE